MKVILQGKPDADHLYAEVSNATVSFYSHELRATRGDMAWMERFFFALPVAQVEDLAKMARIA